jgi:inosine/xanthosine triphosphate pyrophosphatase family protein
MPVRARQSALCTVGVRTRWAGREDSASTATVDGFVYEGAFILYGRTQVLGEIDEHEFGILHRKWARP